MSARRTTTKAEAEHIAPAADAVVPKAKRGASRSKADAGTHVHHAQWRDNMGIQSKILLALGLMALPAFVAMVAVVMAGIQAQRDTAALVAMQRDVLGPIGDLREVTLKERLVLERIAALDEAAVESRYIDQLADVDAELAALIAGLEANETVAQSPEWAALLKAREEWIVLRDDRLVPLARSDNPVSYQAVDSKEGDALRDTVDEQLSALENSMYASADASVAASDATKTKAMILLVIVLAVGVSLSTWLGVLVASTIRARLGRVNQVLAAMARGDLREPLHVRGKDELGQMAAALEVAREALAAVLGDVQTASTTVASAIESMSDAGRQVTMGTQTTAHKAGDVANAADEVSRNVTAVASGAEQMDASIREIAHNANEAAKVATSAAEVASATNDIVVKLSNSSEEIGNVMKTITQIARQTNLLALNATIEAARAGEMGKGFAVVAGEVKDLAQETSRASDEVGHRIAAIQADADAAVEAIREITSIIESINTFQLTIASAVEEQSATTVEMRRGVAVAADGSQSIATSISDVAVATSEAVEVLTHFDESIEELSTLSNTLRSRVAEFTF